MHAAIDIRYQKYVMFWHRASNLLFLRIGPLLGIILICPENIYSTVQRDNVRIQAGGLKTS